MKFLIVTHAIHKANKDKFYSYEPYVREMNLWGNYVDKIKIITPISNLKPESIEIAYSHNNINLEKVPSFDLLTLKNKLCRRIKKYMFIKLCSNKQERHYDQYILSQIPKIPFLKNIQVYYVILIYSCMHVKVN